MSLKHFRGKWFIRNTLGFYEHRISYLSEDTGIFVRIAVPVLYCSAPEEAHSFPLSWRGFQLGCGRPVRCFPRCLRCCRCGSWAAMELKGGPT